MMGAATLESQVVAGKCKLEGDTSVLAKLGSTMIDFELGFEVLPGTLKRTAVEAAAVKKGPFEADDLKFKGGK